MIHTNNPIIKHKVGLLNLAQELGDVSKACKVMGVSRDTFYRYQELVEEGGIDNLINEQELLLEYIFFGPTLSDVGCTYKVISRDSYNKIRDDLKVVGSEFQPELMIKLILKKVRILEIPVNYLEREGKSKITYNFIWSYRCCPGLKRMVLRSFQSNN